MNENYICTSCGYRGKPKKWTKGSFGIELLLWFFFIIPGLIYSIWRLTNKVEVCPSCKQPTMIPSGSPRGQKLMHEFKHNAPKNSDYSDNVVEETSFGLNIFGDKKPPMNNTTKLGMGILLVIILAFFIRGMTGNTDNNKDTVQPKVNTPSASPKNSQIIQPVFDIPSLVGKNLDGVIAELGTPTGQDPTAQQINLGVKEWDKTFKKNGQELLVTYTISNRKIVDFFLSTDDPSGKTKDTTRLMGLGNLKQNDPRYKIEFVKTLKDPSSFTGVKVIPEQ